MKLSTFREFLFFSRTFDVHLKIKKEGNNAQYNYAYKYKYILTHTHACTHQAAVKLQ